MLPRRLLFATAAVCAVAAACEAPLELSAVERERQRTVRRSDLFQAAASNGEVAVVVGSHGAVVVSADDGRRWRRRELDGRPPLVDVAACADGTFVALAFDRSVWIGDRTAATWSRRALPTEESPVAVVCDPRGRYWVTGAFSTLLVSDDGGRRWLDRSFGEDQFLTGLQFVDSDHAVLSAEFGGLYVTSDGGESWRLAEPIPGEFYPLAMHFADRDRGWVAGVRGAVFYTGDGGASWERQATETVAPLYSLVRAGSRIVAVGDHGALLVLGDDGRWLAARKRLETAAYLAAALPMADGGLVVAGGGVLLRLRGEDL